MIGYAGTDGASITKSSETYRYATNNTGTRPAATSSDWKTTKPTLAKGYWLYTETTITWSDGSKTVLYTDERNPNDGIAGQDIIVDGATEMKYYVGDSNTTHPAEDSSDWKDLSQVTQTQGKWLWSKATTWYRKASSAAGSKDAGHSVNYNVSYISKDGKTGRGIQSITEYYQATNSSAARQKPTSESGWDTDPNLSHLTDKWNQSHKYLWNMEKTVYSNVDGTTTTEYSIPQILAIWTKDGDAGRGIDSITNYYKVTSSATAPSKPATPGTDGWSTTPQTPSKGQYLWNYEVITWVNGTPATTETSVQMIGYAGTNGRTPEKGVDYFDGDDGYTVICEPASLVINQGAGNVYDISTTNPAYFKPKVTKGTGTTNLVTAVSVSANYCVKNNRVAIVNVGTWSSANGLPVTGVNATAITNKYTQGYLVLSITADGKTLSITIPIAVNYLNSYIDTIVDGKKTEIAEAVVTQITEDGTFVENNQEYQEVKTAAETSEQWISTVNTPASTVANYNTRISTAEGNISRVEARENSRNMLDCASGDGWKNWDDDYLAEYDNATQKVNGITDSETHQAENVDVYSKAVFLKLGVPYVISLYAPVQPRITIYGLNGNPNATTGGFDDEDHTHHSLTVQTESGTYQNCGRYKAVFTLSAANGDADDYYTFNVYNYQTGLKYFYRPQLEIGDTPTDWVPSTLKNSSSEIKQTANRIMLQVNGKASTGYVDAAAAQVRLGVKTDLSNTGINIEDKIITLTADQTFFKDTQGKDMVQFMMYNGMPSIVFFNENNQIAWVLNYQGMQEIKYNSQQYSWTTLRIAETQLSTNNPISASALSNEQNWSFNNRFRYNEGWTKNQSGVKSYEFGGIYDQKTFVNDTVSSRVPTAAAMSINYAGYFISPRTARDQYSWIRTISYYEIDNANGPSAPKWKNEWIVEIIWDGSEYLCSADGVHYKNTLSVEDLNNADEEPAEELEG